MLIVVIVLVLVAVGAVYLYSSSDGGGDCAVEGEEFSGIFTDEYPESCCSGLTEWDSGFDTGIAVGDKCYETGLEGGWPVGTCINAGDGVCGDLEDPCNSLDDCSGGQNARFEDPLEFCNSEEGFSNYCDNQVSINEYDLCKLCVTS